MRCPRCGFIEDRSGARVCGQCGAGLVALAHPVAPPHAAPRPGAPRPGAPRASGGGYLLPLLLVGGLALAAGGAGIAYWWLVLRSGGSATAGKAEVACDEGACPAIDPARETHLDIKSRDPDLARVSLVVPAGASSSRVTVRVSRAREPLDFIVRGGSHPAKAIGKTIHLEPEGTTFAKPVVLQIPYAAARAKSLGGSPKVAVAVMHRGASGKLELETVKPDAVDAQAGIVTISLRHFSDAVVVAQPEDPNAIKLDGTASGGSGSDSAIKQWPLEKSGPACPDLSKAVKSTPCLTADSDDFFSGVGIDTEWEAVGDYHCPLPGFTDSRAGYRLCRLATYLDTEDGGWTNFKGIGLWNHIPVPPMRSGHEVQLYNAIKDHLRQRAGAPLTQDDLLRLALASSQGDDGKTNLSSALLTAHNVVRAFARPAFWQNDMTPKDGKAFDAQGKARLCPDDHPNCGQTDSETWGHSPSDPMYPIFLDAFGAKSSDGGATLQSLRNARGLPASYLGDGTFQNGIFAAIPGVNPEFAGGCYYYYWVGVMAAAGGETPAKLGIMTESAVKSVSNQGARGKAETSCAYKGVDLVRCMTEAQKNAPAAECPDAGPRLKDAGPLLSLDAGSKPPRSPTPFVKQTSTKSSVVYCEGRCSCCIGGTKEEVLPLMQHCLDIGTSKDNCLERCKRMSEGNEVSEIHLDTCGTGPKPK